MINKRKIIIFKGIIDSLDAFAKELGAGFEKEGCDVLLVDVNDLHYFQDDLFNRIDEYAACEDTIVIFFNSIGMLMDGMDGGNYWNRSGVTCFDILADPPFFYHRAIESDIENVTFICVDEEQSDYINRYYGKESDYYKRNGRVRMSLYMPLAGVVSDTYMERDLQNNRNKDDVDRGISYDFDITAIEAFNNRKYDVIFTGSIRDYEDIDTQIYNLDDSLQDMWDIVLGYICEDTSLTIERAIRKCMSDYSLRLTDEHVHQIILLFKKMDSVIRAMHRQRVITAIADGGIKIDVFGDGWDFLKNKLIHPENLCIHECVSYEESVNIAAQAKISVNVMPWFKTGFHDRIATAMLNGCVSVTDSSSYIDDNYTDGENIVIYKLDNLSELAGNIRTLLENKNNITYRLAMAGKKKAVQADTWHERAKWFLSYCSQITYEQ
jgi:glycosyltransferase involved in cell wall biosynthesis